MKQLLSLLIVLPLLLQAQQPRLILPIGHTATITSAIFSSDGKLVVTASPDKTAKIWDAATGLLLADLKGHTGTITAIQFSPDGSKLLTASEDGIARIWDVLTSQPLVELKGHDGAITTAQYSPDGKSIATVAGNIVKIWDCTNGYLIDQYEKSTGTWMPRIYCVAFSPAGDKILTASSENSAIIWDLKKGDILYELKGHKDDVVYATFSLDGNKIVTISIDSTAKIWDVATGKLLSTFNLNIKNYDATAGFNPDGTRLVTSSGNNTTIWDTRTGKPLAVIKGKVQFGKGPVFSRNGEQFIYSDGDAILLWNIRKAAIVHSFKGHSGEVTVAVFSPDEKKILSAAADKSAKVWDVERGVLLADLKGQSNPVDAASFCPETNQSIAVFGDSTAKVWDELNAIFTREIKTTNSELLGIEYTNDGKKVISFSADTTASCFNIETGSLLWEFRGKKAGIRTVLLSPDETKVLILFRGGIIEVLNIATGTLLYSLNNGVPGFFSARFSYDAQKIITTDFTKGISTWNAGDGSFINKMVNDGGLILDAEYSRDGKKLLITEFENIAIWDAATGRVIARSERIPATRFEYSRFTPNGEKIITIFFNNIDQNLGGIFDGATTNFLTDLRKNGPLANLAGHTGHINEIDFSPDGKRFVTASDDNTAKVWSVAYNSVLCNLVGHTSAVKSARFNTDGTKIITTSSDNTIKIWDSQTGQLIYTYFSLGTAGYFAMLPDGYYKCTPEASKLLHYAAGNLKVITFDQLDVKYNRPDKVLEVIGSRDTGLISSYRNAYNKRTRKLGIDTSSFSNGYSVPETDIVNRDKIKYEQKDRQLSVQIKGVDHTYALDRFNIWINEVPVYGLRGISIRNKNNNEFDTTIVLELSEGENRIETSVFNVNGAESYRMPLSVKYTAVNPVKAKTWFIGIGINNFDNSQYNLKWSVKDIRDFAIKLKEKNKEVHIIDTLFDEKVTVNNIKALKSKLMKVDVNDKVIIAYSGHGLLSNQYDYYLSTYNINFSKPEENGLLYDELENLLDSIPARRKLMLIDACHSGEVDKEELAKMERVQQQLDSSKRGVIVLVDTVAGRVGMKNSFELMRELFVNVNKGTGATIISAATGTQFALERGDLKNGVFTYCILKAMGRKGSVKVSELKRIVSTEVSTLTQGLQQPTFRNEMLYVDWDVW